jgi:hypothetical protein
MEWAYAAAKDPYTPTKILEEIYGFENCRLWLSQNPSCSAKLLEKLGKKEAFEHLDPTNWRMAVANVLRHKNTSTKTIIEILKWTDGFLNVKRPDDEPEWISDRLDTYFESSAASNFNTPVEWLKKFEKSSDETTIFWLLGNPNLPKDLIQKYVDMVLKTFEHEDLHKYSGVSTNTSLTFLQIEKLSQHPKYYIRENIGRNLSTPESILIKLLSDPETQVQYGVIFNPHTPFKLLKQRYLLANSDLLKLGINEPGRYRESIKLAASRHQDQDGEL